VCRVGKKNMDLDIGIGMSGIMSPGDIAITVTLGLDDITTMRGTNRGDIHAGTTDCSMQISDLRIAINPRDLSGFQLWKPNWLALSFSGDNRGHVVARSQVVSVAGRICKCRKAQLSRPHTRQEI
jgi:hypothetical protein